MFTRKKERGRCRSGEMLGVDEGWCCVDGMMVKSELGASLVDKCRGQVFWTGNHPFVALTLCVHDFRLVAWNRLGGLRPKTPPISSYQGNMT